MDEEGTEATAASGSEITAFTVPPVIKVDRPFLFMIFEETFKTLLFIGRVVDPTEMWIKVTVSIPGYVRSFISILLIYIRRKRQWNMKIWKPVLPLQLGVGHPINILLMPKYQAKFTEAQSDKNASCKIYHAN